MPTICRAALRDLRRDRHRVPRDAPSVPAAIGAGRSACATGSTTRATGRHWCVDRAQLARRGPARPLHHARPRLGRAGAASRASRARCSTSGSTRRSATSPRAGMGEADAGRDWRDWWQGATTCATCSSWPRTTCRSTPSASRRPLSAPACRWKLVDIIKGFNWLTFEGGKFSTSRRRGIFTDPALELCRPIIGAGGWPPMRRKAAMRTSPSSASPAA